LFAGSDPRGPALVAYLAGLGAATTPARQADLAAWRPALVPGSAAEAVQAGRLFAEACACCHGAAGRGDGPLAAQLSDQPPDFRRNRWRQGAANGSVSVEAVARVIKFGEAGTPMAGHEYLDDADAVALARFVITLHGPAQPL
ncbi:MAG: c-type cytochrome, partial [Opitutales bacterium]